MCFCLPLLTLDLVYGCPAKKKGKSYVSGYTGDTHIILLFPSLGKGLLGHHGL